MPTDSDRDRRTLIQLAEANVDHAAIERRRREQAQRATDDRIAHLRWVLFENGTHGRSVKALADEPTASRALIRAHNNADNLAVLGILRTAIDNHWHDVVRAGIRHFGEGPTATALREICEHSLTTDQHAV